LLLGSARPAGARSRISLSLSVRHPICSERFYNSFLRQRVYISFLGPTGQHAAAAFFNFALFLFFYSKKSPPSVLRGIIHQCYCTVLSRENRVAAFFNFALFLFFYSKKSPPSVLHGIMHQCYCTVLSREKWVTI
jgi:hypothetical protein